MKMRKFELGAISSSIFAIVALVILVVVFGGFSIWAYINYLDQKQDVDGKVASATAAARLDQAAKDEEKMIEAEKNPLRTFAGPSDYGSLTFQYPKTWSVYQATDVSQGGGVTYEAYLHPIVVPPIAVKTQKFALRVTIEQKTYDKALETYNALVKKGDMKASAYTDGTHTGTRFDGSFTKDMVGTAILIKMRDRTLTMRTDGDVFKADYEALLKTLKFNE